MRKLPRKPAPSQLRDLADPVRRFRADASRLAKKAKGIDPEGLAVAMSEASVQYLDLMKLHWEGGRRSILNRVVKVSEAASSLLKAAENLGPIGCGVALDHPSGLIDFLHTPVGMWLVRTANLKVQFHEELEDLPCDGVGRPVDSTRFQRHARLKLLELICRFLEPLLLELDEYQQKALEKLPPEIARAVHRIVIEPKMPKDSQLFDKEWEGLLSSNTSEDDD